MLYVYEKSSLKKLMEINGEIISKDAVRLNGGSVLIIPSTCELSEDENLTQTLLEKWGNEPSDKQRLDLIEEVLAEIIFGGGNIV